MKFLEHYFSSEGPGAALAVIAEGESPAFASWGYADLDSRDPITPDTAFELASASKWLTATAILSLVEREGLELEAPVDALLPELGGTRGSRPITIRDLLWHTSGLTDYLEDGAFTPAERLTRRHVSSRLPEWAASAEPGVEHRYSNTNYYVLARVVEAVAGLEFGEFVDQTLVEPFGLTSTSACPRFGRRTARGYRNLGYGLPRFEPVEELAIDTDGDGGILSSARDLARWQSLFWHGEIVGADSVRRMSTPGELDSGERFAYGMGLQIESGGGSTWCGHGGSWTSSTTLMGRYLEAGVSVVVLSNEIVAPVERLSQRALAGYQDAGASR